MSLENSLVIAGENIPPGKKVQIEIPVSRLPTQTLVSLPVIAINGMQSGPRLWLSAAIHGDELNGVEIIRQVLKQIEPQKLTGSILAVPIVNVFGFLEQSRYLPDRRDLNRSFPGSETGSLASRLANLFMREIVNHSTHGIDLHTAAIHRFNFPQIRANLADEQTRDFAQAFAAPITIQANTRDGSLRQAATKKNIPVLLYEGGEPLRFNSQAIQVGLKGIFNVMNYLGMYKPANFSLPQEFTSITIFKTKWLRASRGGILTLNVKLGQKVAKKQELGTISDAFGENSLTIKASHPGIVISYTQNPLVNQGDAIIHLGLLEMNEV